MNTTNNKPLLSICMVTYNHEKYIAEALTSIIFQKTNFNFEVIIGEDCSTDNTRSIIENFCNKYPDKFSPIYHSKNIGSKNNIDSVFRKCQGKYIAILEGDDYWTDENKLQKQVNFLEENLQYSSCFHNVKTINGTNKNRTWSFCKFNQDEAFKTDDILKMNFIPTCSNVFRNNLSEQFLEVNKIVSAGDWYLHIYNSEFGEIYYINEFMGVYRAHQNGQWAGLSQIEGAKFKINALFDIDRAFDFKYTNKIREIIFDMYKNKPVGYKDLIRYYKKKLKK